MYLLATGLAEAVAIMHDRHGAPEEAVVDAVLAAIADCGALLPARAVAADGCCGNGEAPLLQAALLYALQAAALPRLTGAAQRRLLSDLGGRCRVLAAPPLGGGAAAPPPAEAVVVCGAMSLVLRALGEVPVETARSLRDAVHRLLIQSPPVAAYAAAAVLGQLAAVEGASASELVMEYLSLATLQAAAFGSQSGPRRGATNPVLSASDGVPAPPSSLPVFMHVLLQAPPSACDCTCASDAPSASDHGRVPCLQRESAPHRHPLHAAV